MKNQTLLFLMTEETPETEVQQLAEHAAAENARLICFLMAPMPIQPMNASAGVPYGGVEISTQWMELVNDVRARLTERCDRLEAVLQRAAVAGDVQLAYGAQPDIRAAVADRALVSDMAIAATNLRDAQEGLFRAAAYGVLFDGPGPLLINVSLLTLPKHIFIGWDTELPAARAVHAALPLLVRANEVTVACFDPESIQTADGEDPGADLAEWLSHHGCTVTVSQYPSGGDDIGTAMQRRAREVGADLIVMGAFGRSRLHELVFGGTTRTMLNQTDTAVLMAH